MNINSALNVPLVLSQPDQQFIDFINLGKDLLFGYLSQRPAEERSLMKDTYFNFHKKEDEQWNQRHADRLKEIQQLFEVQEGVLLQIKNPKKYKDRKFRIILDAECRFLYEECLARFGRVDYGPLHLKIDSTTFVPDRALEVFLYSQGLVGEDKEKQKNLIKQADDYIYLCEHLTQDGPAGRSTLGKASGNVILFIQNLAISILINHQLVKEDARQNNNYHGQIHKFPHKVKEISRNDRLILLVNTFADVLSDFEFLRQGALYRIYKIINKDQKHRWEIKKNGCQLPHAVKIHLEMEQKKFCDLIQEHMQGKQFPSFEKEDFAVIEGFGLGFFTEAEKTCSSLKDFITLLNIRCEQDFTPKEKEFAKEYRKKQELKSSSSAHLRHSSVSLTSFSSPSQPTSRTRSNSSLAELNHTLVPMENSSIFQPENEEDTVLQDKKKLNRLSQFAKKIWQSSSLANHSTPTKDLSNLEDLCKLEECIEAFSHILVVFEKIVEAGKFLKT